MKHVLLLSVIVACNGDKDPSSNTPTDTGDPLDTPVEELEVDSWAHGCYAVRSGDAWLEADGSAYAFTTTASEATPFVMQPSDLGTYLLYDDGGQFLSAEDGPVERVAALESDISRIEDGYVSGGEWVLETAPRGGAYVLRSRRNGSYFAEGALEADPADAAAVTFEAAEGCATFPEMSLDAEGAVTTTTFDDGDLYGIVDMHSHILSNLAFGGGALFHGAPFHRLGVEHALSDCAPFHGDAGRKDIFGYVNDNGRDIEDISTVFIDLLAGKLSEDNHVTDGWPAFTEWPNARKRSTHQQQYYRWLERAWMGGLRLVVQHATTNSAICSLTVGEGIQPSWYDCEDMTAVDRIIDATYDMERYIDAQSGGEGAGWFRVVTSPAEARAVISAGKMAVVLGIETSDLFDCHITPRPGGPTCDGAYVEEKLDEYHDRGVRVLFPVHKYDNQFSAGDGHKGIIELGNFTNSGHWTNMTLDCPADEQDMPRGFDKGSLSFAGLLSPREDYTGTPPNDLSGFQDAPLATILPYAGKLLEGGESGDWCQNAGLTPLGESLMMGMMSRGMLIEVDHFPQRSYVRAYELLEEFDYPAIGSHGRDWYGRLYALGGVSNHGMSRCADPDAPGQLTASLLDEADLIESMGGYPAPGLGFDLNGFAGGPRPRFGDEGCGNDQPNPMSYPFTSFGGDVTFTQPYLGERAVDFDTEGMIHIGLLPELLEDARADAVSEADLEPLFRSAEGYVRMWERAESRAAEISGE